MVADEPWSVACQRRTEREAVVPNRSEVGSLVGRKVVGRHILVVDRRSSLAAASLGLVQSKPESA
jgi:hypothetical protein